MDKPAILDILDKMQDSLNLIRTLVTVNPEPQKKPTLKSKISTAQSLPAGDLGPQPDYKAKAWPQSVMPHMIVTNKGAAEKQFRALQISRLIGDYNKQTVLDVGCDEGYLTKELANQAKMVVGYDIRPNPNWAKFSELATFTTKRSEVENNHYDVIVMYDVLDHLEDDDPVKFMVWLNSILAPGGRIFVRTHPWTSKHGGHLYEHDYNLAFLHLAMTPDELAQAGIETINSLKLNRPMAAYDYIFREAGFSVKERKGHSEPVDPFFSGDLLKRIIKVTWKGAIDQDSALKIMSNTFVDYTLTVADDH